MTDEAMTAVEPIPCPIDGGAAEWREIPIRGTGSSGMEAPDLSIRCTVCGLETTRERTERWERGRGTYSIRSEAEAKLLARWNIRVLARQSVGVEEIESAKKQVQAARDTLNSAIQKLVDVQVEALSRLGDSAALNSTTAS